jgi:hypothetical protein
VVLSESLIYRLSPLLLHKLKSIQNPDDLHTASVTMNAITSSKQRPAVSPLLAPIDTLKQLWLREKTTFKQKWIRKKRRDFPFSEYRLNGMPQSLKTFVDHFLLANGRSEKDRLIWTSKNAFVTMSIRHKLPGAYQYIKFEVGLTSGSHDHYLFIHSSTVEDAMSCFDFLIGLNDAYFEVMTFYDNSISGERERRLCPLTSVLLEKIILQSAKRKNVFIDITFTPDQSRTLATSGRGSDIGLIRCKFQDDGEAFLEALAAREDQETGLTKLSIWNGLPFAESNWVLSLHMLKCLSLHFMHLESEEACRAVVEAELQYLELEHCELGDGGAALVESVRDRRGPKGLILHRTGREDDWHPFDSSERFVSFMNALRGNSHLERLVLPCFDLRERGIRDALAAALLESKGLVHLGLQVCHSDEISFCELLSAISKHSSLRTLDFTRISISTMNGTDATKAVAKMLSDNKQLEEIRFRDDDDDDDDDSPFDPTAWDKLVTPRLECNVYRKRFHAIQEIRPLFTRAAVLASALVHVSNKPSPVFMLLRQNIDILSSYLVDE